MRVEPIVPDVPRETARPAHGAGTFGELIAAAGAQLERADVAERAFSHGSGGLTAMVVERARADISLAIAASGAQRAAQALNTLLGMQI